MKYKELFDYLGKKCNFRKKKGIPTWNCDNELTFTKEFCKKHKLNFERIKKRLEDTGGYCDCEVLFNSIHKINNLEDLQIKTYKIQGMGDEEYVKSCAYCRGNEICNVCRYYPEDISKHKHKFSYIKTLIKSNIFRRIFNMELRTKMYRCPCGKIRQEGHQINKLPQFWDETLV